MRLFFNSSRVYKTITVTALLLVLTDPNAKGFTFVTTSSGKFAPNTIVHPAGYDGKGGALKITLGLHSDFEHLEENFRFSATQTVTTWNHLLSSKQNLNPSLEIPTNGGIDVFGVLIHECGHTLGLAHPTHKVSAMIGQGIGQFAMALPGPNGKLDLNSGSDGLRGTADDKRADDVNLVYFKITDNNPFTLQQEGVYDSTTYSRKLEDLPSGHLFPVIHTRENSKELFSLTNCEGMMVSGGSLRPGQVRRTLTADDVAVSVLRWVVSMKLKVQETITSLSWNMWESMRALIF